MTRVHVVVAAYDCPEPLRRCLSSIKGQTYQNTTVSVVDDASPTTGMHSIVNAVNEFDGWTGIVNLERVGATANIWDAIKERPNPDPMDVVLLVDGDDRLPHHSTVERIVAEYEADEGVWLAWGQYVSEPADSGPHPAMAYPADVVRDRSFRNAQNLFNHPITFRAFLFDQLTETDLRLASGKWVPGVYDEALMYPMLEIAGPRVRCMPDVHYVYNTVNPLSVNRTMLDQITAAGEELRARPKRRRMFWSDRRGGLKLGADDRAALIADVARRLDLSFVVETGSSGGYLTERMIGYDHINRAVTIERDHDRYMGACARLLHTPKVQPLHGSSTDMIRALATGIPTACWWLGAGNDYGPGPLLDDLYQILARRQPDAVFVDDAWLCGRNGNPTVDTVRSHVANLSDGHSVAVADDVIRIEPAGG